MGAEFPHQERVSKVGAAQQSLDQGTLITTNTARLQFDSRQRDLHERVSVGGARTEASPRRAHPLEAHDSRLLTNQVRNH
jgi:hypothetical protein